MAFTFCLSGAAIRRAGANANSDITISGGALNQFSEEAEAMINAETRYDWVANWASVGANFQSALAQAETALIAMNLINYDMSGYTTRLEVQTMLDVLRDQYKNAIDILKKKENQEKMV